MKSRGAKQPFFTSSGDAEAELKDNPAEIASEAGLVGAVDRDYTRLAGTFPYLNHHHILARHPHHRPCCPRCRCRRRSRSSSQLSSALPPCPIYPCLGYGVTAGYSPRHHPYPPRGIQGIAGKLHRGPLFPAAGGSWSIYAVDPKQPTDRVNTVRSVAAHQIGRSM